MKKYHPDEVVGTVKTHNCGFCGQTFIFKKHLISHLHQRHSVERSTWLCDICGKSVTDKWSLKHHRMIHTGERPVVCEVCGKGFKNKTLLKVHFRSHSGEKPYTCGTCGKMFTQRSSLNIHERYHSGDRPYACMVCGKGFVSRTLMNSHQKSNHSMTRNKGEEDGSKNS
uniref:C2H2-type domain-containing protein n=1 Tax=Timema bartmani TaxID=61472 RepID=A0A7R9ENT0_9NEOP|nr:unnamed protein product [Timema bartmani]